MNILLTDLCTHSKRALNGSISNIVGKLVERFE